MSQPVVIKGNKHGIIVVLDAEAEFKDLKVQIEEKFKASAKFFGSADMALGFEGRVLSDEQQREVLDIIANVSQLNIICIIDHDEAQDAVFKAPLIRRFLPVLWQLRRRPVQMTVSSTKAVCVPVRYLKRKAVLSYSVM